MNTASQQTEFLNNLGRLLRNSRGDDFASNAKTLIKRDLAKLPKLYNIEFGPDKALGFLPAGSSEILDFCRINPTAVESQFHVFDDMSKNEILFNGVDYWSMPNFWPIGSDVANWLNFQNNQFRYAWWHFDFCGFWGAPSTSTDRVINAVSVNLADKAILAFTHNENSRRTGLKHIEELKKQFVAARPNSSFAWRCKTDIKEANWLCLVQTILSTNFKYSVELVYAAKYHNGVQGWTGRTTAIFVDKSKPYSDEEALRSYYNCLGQGLYYNNKSISRSQYI